MNFGERIRYRRENLEISRHELAKMVKINYYTLAKYETGVNEPDLATLVEIAKALKVSTDYILSMPSGVASIPIGEEELLKKYRSLLKSAQERIQHHLDFECYQQSQIKETPA